MYEGEEISFAAANPKSKKKYLSIYLATLCYHTVLMFKCLSSCFGLGAHVSVVEFIYV